MPLSNFTRNDILDDIIGDAETVYVALCTVLPDFEDVGVVELTDTNYARVAHSVWATVAGTGTVPTVRVNTGPIEFAELLAAANDVIGFAIYDAITSGNLIAFGNFVDPLTDDLISQDYEAGDVPRFLGGDLKVA